VTGFLDIGSLSNTQVVASGYEGDTRYIRGTSQDVKLYRIERIIAGESTTVTVRSDDSLCNNNLQTPGFGSKEICRTVRVIAPSDGRMTLEAVSTESGKHARLEVEAISTTPCCAERIENPTSVQVRAGAEVLASVEIASSSSASESFTLFTSMSP
jgi:hypothetical protein